MLDAYFCKNHQLVINTTNTLNYINLIDIMRQHHFSIKFLQHNYASEQLQKSSSACFENSSKKSFQHKYASTKSKLRSDFRTSSKLFPQLVNYKCQPSILKRVLKETMLIRTLIHRLASCIISYQVMKMLSHNFLRIHFFNFFSWLDI